MGSDTIFRFLIEAIKLVVRRYTRYYLFLQNYLR
jgi:hypothetical protein